MTHVFEGEFVHQNLGRIRKEFRVDQMCEWETRKAAVRGLFFCEHGIVIDTCEELDHLGEQAMQYLNITLREKDTQVIPLLCRRNVLGAGGSGGSKGCAG